MADLGFLEVGLNPDVLVRHQRQQIRAGLHVLAVACGTLADKAADRRVDLGAGDIQLGLCQVGAGTGDLRFKALDFGLQGADLLALSLQVRLRFAHVRAGDTAVGGQGGDPLLGDIAGFAQGLRAR
ncbi:hypothetical protein D9M68_692580 [compost metagenome]